jgi:hypothetical protein
MALAHQAPSVLSFRLRRRTLRKLSAELARLEAAARAARAECRHLEEGRAREVARPGGGDGTLPEGASRTDQVLAAARRREEALRIAIGDCRAEMFKVLVQTRQIRPEEDAVLGPDLR